MSNKESTNEVVEESEVIEEKKEEKKEVKVEEKPCYLVAVRTTGGQEGNIALILKAKIENKNIDIPAIIIVPDLKGFIFVETPLNYLVQSIAYGIKHVKGILRGKIPADEILKVIYKPTIINPGDIVEVIAGPFRGIKGKVISIEKDRVRIEPLELATILPIDLKISEVRKIPQKKEE